MSWDRVEDWLARLQEADVQALPLDGLSDATTLWRDALSRIGEGLLAARAVQGRPYETAVFVAARTVFTAPLEWIALLLGHGTRVVLKHPTGSPGAVPVLVEAARLAGLPLSATDDRDAVLDAELVIAMGSDETMDALRSELPADTTALLFGHRFSAAWVEADSPAAWADVAEALWPYDSRGCFSPQIVLSPVPLDRAVAALGRAMTDAQQAHPRGVIGRAEAASIRARGALAKIVGAEAHGEGWAVHGLAAEHWSPGGLPRCVAVVQVADRAEACGLLEPWARWLSSVGDDSGEAWFDARVCPTAQLQRPKLVRRHDGVELIRAVVRPT